MAKKRTIITDQEIIDALEAGEDNGKVLAKTLDITTATLIKRLLKITMETGKIHKLSNLYPGTSNVHMSEKGSIGIPNNRLKDCGFKPEQEFKVSWDKKSIILTAIKSK
jgi:hypothetical protein